MALDRSTIKCVNCGDEFEPQPSRGGAISNYCSDCLEKWQEDGDYYDS